MQVEIPEDLKVLSEDSKPPQSALPVLCTELDEVKLAETRLAAISAHKAGQVVGSRSVSEEQMRLARKEVAMAMRYLRMAFRTLRETQ